MSPQSFATQNALGDLLRQFFCLKYVLYEGHLKSLEALRAVDKTEARQLEKIIGACSWIAGDIQMMIYGRRIHSFSMILQRFQ